jgi:hypothetical protein
VVRSVSATQIKQFRSCGLQWYLQRVEGWEMPQSASQALGEAIHSQVERYLLDGTTPELPSVENAIRKALVPAYGTQDSRIVEEPKDYGMGLTLAGVPVKGRIDLMLPPVDGGARVTVVDWKSASSFAYTPTADALTRDVQGVLYLRYAFEQYPYATEGQFRHVYLLTKGTGSKKVDGEVVDPYWVEGQWRHLEQTVEEMKSTAGRSLPVVTTSQANLSHCDAYGGCKFRDRCPAASKGLVASMFDVEATAGTGASTAEGEDMTTLAEKLKARRLATLGTTTPAETITASEPEPVVEPVVEPVLEVVAPVAVLPPDAPKAEASNEANDRPIPGKVAPKGRVRPFSKKEAEPVVDPEPVVAPVIEVEHVEPPVVERKPDPDVVKAAEIIREKWIEEGSKRPLSLYIDCFPEKAEFENLRALEDEIAARTPSLLEHLRKTSPKDVPEGAVDLGEVLYGRGYATLTASFALKPLTGPWLVSTLYPASSKVLEVLLPKATFVVRGRR